MNDYVSNFLQHGGQLDSFLAAAVLWISFAAIGSLFIKRGQALENAPFLGWALVSLIFTVLGVFTNIPFTYVAITIAVLAVAAGVKVIRSGGGLLAGGTIKIVILGAPLLLLVSAMVGSQWDEFGHWLISPRLLLETDAFPNRDNYLRSGSLPAYPFSWHFVTYLASLLSGRFLENAGALFNVFMLLSFSLVAARLMRAGVGGDEEGPAPGWVMCATGALVAIVLSTTFAQKVALTSYADIATAASLGMGGLTGWYMLGALAEGRGRQSRNYALQFGLIMMLLVNLKQSTLVLFILLLGGIILTALRDPHVKLSGLGKCLPWMIIPPIIIYIIWRYYVTMELPGREMNMKPVSDWLISYIPEILSKMLLVLSKKGAFLVLMIVIIGFGVRAMIHYRTPFDRLAIIVAAVFLGHNLFLLFAYVSTFGKFDALRAASYWRYNMQIGLLGVLFTSYGLGLAWKTYGQGRWNIQKSGWVAIVLMLMAPVIFANKLRFDLFQPIPHFRVVGAEINKLLSDGDALSVVDPKGSGESGMITRYEMGGTGIYRGFIGFFQKPTLEILKGHVGSGNYSHILVHSVTPDVTGALNVDLATDQSHLLEIDDTGAWRIIKSWPLPQS
ncbi:MAG: hypothetical protein ISR45_01845 [Rhodospirillales bacterium]|nr:hypothetical protein [Rhodospirillales bacterium]